MAGDEAVKAGEALTLLYSHFMEHEDRLPPEFAGLPGDKERKVVDYIAGMTDQYALRLAEKMSQ